MSKAKKKRLDRRIKQAMKEIDATAKQKEEEVHKISKLSETKPQILQGGAPGLGKKS